MKNKIINFLPFLFLLFIVSSCSHETDEFDGPNLVDRFGEFELIEGLQISRETVDFSAGQTVSFTAKFNKRINFVLVIEGNESKARKIIEGFDSEVKPENATWGGGTTELPFFRAENCTVELIIPEADSLTFSGAVEVLGTKVYEGSLLTGFEEDPVDNIFFGNFEFELTANTGRTNNGMAAEGDYYYYFEGTDNVVPNFFAGLIDIKATIAGDNYVDVPTTVPEELYFNCFLLSDASPHGIVVIQIIIDSNDSGEFEDGVDASYPIGDLNTNWVGWRHVSVPLSDLGITEEDASKIVAVRALLISDMNSQPSPPLQVNYGLDFITFTAGGPLEL